MIKVLYLREINITYLLTYITRLEATKQGLACIKNKTTITKIIPFPAIMSLLVSKLLEFLQIYDFAGRDYS